MDAKQGEKRIGSAVASLRPRDLQEAIFEEAAPLTGRMPHWA
jgi:hypothetical protein